MQHKNKFALLGYLLSIGLLAGLLISCQPASEETEVARLSLLEWNGYQKPKYYPDFIAKYGYEPEYTFFVQADAALKRLRTGFKADLVHLCTGQMNEAWEAGLIKPIDTDRIERWGEITPLLLDVKHVQIDGKYMIVPWEWGYSTVGYNPETIEVENPGFDMYVDPRYKGKTALSPDIAVNLIIAGVIGGWADPLDPTEAEMQAAPEIFTKMLGNARFIWADSTQLEQAWSGGDVGISYIFGSASRRMPKEGMPVVVVEPLLTWMCGLSITTNGEASEDEAYDYINAMLDPRSGAALFDEYGYGHGNARSVDLVDPDRATSAGIDDPVGTFARGIYTSGLPPAKKARLFQLWFEAMAGLD